MVTNLLNSGNVTSAILNPNDYICLMKEKDLQTRVTAYMKNRWKGTAVFELKICHEKSMPFEMVKEHQIHALHSAKTGVIAYKIPDVGFDQKPFDMIVLDKVSAYVLVMFYTRGCNHFYIIDVDRYVAESELSERRSLTEERAQEIGEKIVMQ